jgi:hypothetical protein
MVSRQLLWHTSGRHFMEVRVVISGGMLTNIKICCNIFYSNLTVLVAHFEAFTAVMFQVEVFWVVTPCNVVG